MEYPQAYCEKLRIARKPHKCCECGGTIFYKEQYHYCSGVWDNRGESYKTCMDCYQLRSDINSISSYDEGVCLGELREYIFEGMHKPDVQTFVDIMDKRGVKVSSDTRYFLRTGKII